MFSVSDALRVYLSGLKCDTSTVTVMALLEHKQIVIHRATCDR